MVTTAFLFASSQVKLKVPCRMLAVLLVTTMVPELAKAPVTPVEDEINMAFAIPPITKVPVSTGIVNAMVVFVVLPGLTAF